MSIRFMPKDRQLLLLLGTLFALLMAGVVITMLIYQTAANNVMKRSVPQKCRHGYTTCAYLKRSGLGNLLFQYASILGITKSRMMKPIIPPEFSLRAYFKMSERDNYETVKTADWPHYYEIKSNSYDGYLVTKLNPCQNLTVVGYLQSYEYFKDIYSEISSALEFHDNIKLTAQQFIEDAFNSVFRNVESKDVTYIGIHARRGDMVSHNAKQYGYDSPSRDYYLNAIKRYKNVFANSKLLFIVTSDDIPWCEKNFEDISANFVYSKGHPDYVDLAILSQCNHTIISSGTFSWWAGWLAGGNVTYYTGFPIPGSKLDSGFSTHKLDYYPSSWIGLN